MYIWQEDEKSFACRNGPTYGLRVGRARLLGCVSMVLRFVLVLNVSLRSPILYALAEGHLQPNKHVGFAQLHAYVEAPLPAFLNSDKRHR
jgi:hypothetical protein